MNLANSSPPFQTREPVQIKAPRNPYTQTQALRLTCTAPGLFTKVKQPQNNGSKYVLWDLPLLDPSEGFLTLPPPPEPPVLAFAQM